MTRTRLIKFRFSNLSKCIIIFEWEKEREIDIESRLQSKYYLFLCCRSRLIMKESCHFHNHGGHSCAHQKKVSILCVERESFPIQREIIAHFNDCAFWEKENWNPSLTHSTMSQSQSVSQLKKKKKRSNFLSIFAHDAHFQLAKTRVIIGCFDLTGRLKRIKLRFLAKLLNF
jgi:hypothetical protein